MQSFDDLPLRPDDDEPAPRAERGRRAIWAVIAVVLVIAAAAAAFVLFRPAPPSPEPGAAPVTGADVALPAQPEPLPPLGAEAAEVELPPLDLSDPMVRDLLRVLSSRPELATWLATDNLLRHGVAAIDNVARGRTPTSQFRVLAPTEPFATEASAPDRLVVSPRAHARYDSLAQTFASLETRGLSSVYATLRPRMMDAYRELGYPDGNVDAAVERAIVHLLRTPAVEATTAVQSSAVMYTYVDPRLEGLSPAQKQLLRMGPQNVRIVQQKLREIAAALGIPADRLPGAS